MGKLGRAPMSDSYEALVDCTASPVEAEALAKAALQILSKAA
jgi:hypothetical protein